MIIIIVNSKKKKKSHGRRPLKSSIFTVYFIELTGIVYLLNNENRPMTPVYIIANQPKRYNLLSKMTFIV